MSDNWSTFLPPRLPLSSPGRRVGGEGGEFVVGSVPPTNTSCGGRDTPSDMAMSHSYFGMNISFNSFETSLELTNAVKLALYDPIYSCS